MFVEKQVRATQSALGLSTVKRERFADRHARMGLRGHLGSGGHLAQTVPLVWSHEQWDLASAWHMRLGLPASLLTGLPNKAVIAFVKPPVVTHAAPEPRVIGMPLAPAVSHAAQDPERIRFLYF